MKRNLLLLLALSPVLLLAQTIKNGAFENWLTYPYDEPLGWSTANSDGQSEYASVFTVTKVSDDASGFAVKLETKKVGTTIIEAWMSSSEGDPMQGTGGFPFTQKPDKFTFRYKANIVGNDTNVVILIFKKNGSVFQMEGAQLPNSQSTFTTYTINLNLTQTPDSIIIAAAASNLLEYHGVEAGTWFIIDKMQFEGTGITQVVPNGNMDNWVSKSIDDLPDWYMSGKEGIKMSTDAYRGSKAISMSTFKYSDGYVGQARISLSEKDDNDNTIRSGIPYNLTSDTLFGYYKYSSPGADSAYAFVRLYKNGTQLGWFGRWLPKTSTYKRFSIDFAVMQTPDTIDVSFESSSSDSRVEGSVLVLDEVQLASSPLNTTGLPKRLFERTFNLYPNPCNEYLRIESGNDPILVQVFSGNGNLVSVKHLEANQTSEWSTTGWTQGLYFCIVQTPDGRQQFRKILVE